MQSSLPCPTFSLAHLEGDALLQIFFISSQCTSAVALATFFLVCLALRILHLSYAIYRIYLYRTTIDSWKPIWKNQGVLTETAHDILGIIADVLHLSGVPYLGYFAASCMGDVAQLCMFTNAYRIIATIATSINGDAASIKHHYRKDMQILGFCISVQLIIAACGAAFLHDHDVRSFNIANMTGYASLMISSMWYTYRLLGAVKTCQILIDR